MQKPGSPLGTRSLTGGFPKWRDAVVFVAVGVAALLGGGGVAELWWLGPTDDAAFEKVRQHVEKTFADMVSSLEVTAVTLASRPEVVAGIGGDPDAQTALFEVTRAAWSGPSETDVAITVYGASATARAWTGRPSEIPQERILGKRTFFVAPSALGLRLVYIEPVIESLDVAAGRQRRLGSVAAERVLSLAGGVTNTPSDALDAPIAHVAIRARYEDGGTQPGPRSFELRSPSGDLLLEAQVSDADLNEARANWRHSVENVIWVFVALIILLGTVPLLTWTPRGTSAWRALGLGASASAGVALVYGLLRTVSTPGLFHVGLFAPDTYSSVRLPTVLRSPADLLLASMLFAGVVLIVASLVERGRVGWRGHRRSTSDTRLPVFLSVHILGGAVLAAILLSLHLLIEDTVAGTSVDLQHTSLHPWDSGRIGLLAGLVFAAAAAVWSGVTALIATQLFWHHRRFESVPTVSTILTWGVPGVAAAWVSHAPPLPYLLLFGGCVIAALCSSKARPWFRHASQASRILTLFLVLLLPALLMYPSLQHYTDRSKRRFVEVQYAEQAARHPEELQAQLNEALTQIDGIPNLQAMTSSMSPTDRPDSAFFVWRQTDLAQLRLTSAIELYGASGALISRFALNFPEYGGAPQDWRASRCDWDIFGEVLPFGSQERRILHAERAICPPAMDGHTDTPASGSVVVHVALDYQALPFISSQNPYIELLRQAPQTNEEGQAGQNIELVIYGWGQQPIFSSGQNAWLLDDALFDRVYTSREPFWTTRPKGGRDYDVYVVNNRDGIYALGYPVFTVFDHLVRLAETTALAGVLFLGLVILVTCGLELTRSRYRFGRALFREVRTSFYRRLFLAFVAATVIPVLALALVIRSYFTTQLRTDVEAGAARTAAVAQRVIEESLGFQQIGEESTAVINDDLLVWISQIIDQDVNIFEGPQLLATSERDLFASGLLPTRTPDAVYAAIALEHMPSYVTEDAIGSLRYLVASTPIRAEGRDAILTVPLASRQQEIERQIDDLDRGILLGVTLFILLGAGGGFYMAERIADPVKRLTRATGQIARGDFDAEIMVKSADELQRLVVAFNRMAVDLKEQRQRLERTHRLEAWAEMARQVAHEIKNPLTPVQLSAEHLLQVHHDRGEPLSPVLQNCVGSILTQVRILRQISAEFSSYASSPTVILEATSLAVVVNDVLQPYLIGLEGRIIVTVDIPDTLPALPMDRVLVGRALTNVVENALHAMPGEGVLFVRAAASATAVELTLTDTGVGLDKASLQRIFEPYFSTKALGTGLGMAIAKRNVELNGGTITVTSLKDRGTSVRITFSLTENAPGQDGGSSPPATTPYEADRSRSET